MCRWLAYYGTPVLLEELLFKPQHSLIDQSLHSTLGAETTNGDGFGIGWYGDGETPGVFHSIEPAWNDRNLRDLAAHLESGARLRTHPRVVGIAGAADELPSLPPRPMAVDAQRRRPRVPRREAGPRARRSTRSSTRTIEGSTDSEVFFFLALTLGLEDDPPAAVARAVGLDRGRRRRHGVEHPIQMTVATSDGRACGPFATRARAAHARSSSRRASTRCASSTPRSRSCSELSDESRLVVSEPLGDLEGAWNEVPESQLRRRAGRTGRAPRVRADPTRLSRPLTRERARCSLLRFGLLRSLGRERDHRGAEERDPRPQYATILCDSGGASRSSRSNVPMTIETRGCTRTPSRPTSASLPVARESLLHDEREDPRERERIGLPARQDRADPVVADDLDRGLAQRRGQPVQDASTGAV